MLTINENAEYGSVFVVGWRFWGESKDAQTFKIKSISKNEAIQRIIFHLWQEHGLPSNVAMSCRDVKAHYSESGLTVTNFDKKRGYKTWDSIDGLEIEHIIDLPDSKGSVLFAKMPPPAGGYQLLIAYGGDMACSEARFETIQEAVDAYNNDPHSELIKSLSMGHEERVELGKLDDRRRNIRFSEPLLPADEARYRELLKKYTRLIERQETIRTSCNVCQEAEGEVFSRPADIGTAIPGEHPSIRR